MWKQASREREGAEDSLHVKIGRALESLFLGVCV